MEGLRRARRPRSGAAGICIPRREGLSHRLQAVPQGNRTKGLSPKGTSPLYVNRSHGPSRSLPDSRTARFPSARRGDRCIALMCSIVYANRRHCKRCISERYKKVHYLK
jgi:hypothetical protein